MIPNAYFIEVHHFETPTAVTDKSSQSKTLKCVELGGVHTRSYMKESV